MISSHSEGEAGLPVSRIRGTGDVPGGHKRQQAPAPLTAPGLTPTLGWYQRRLSFPTLTAVLSATSTTICGLLATQ